jgi:hypothetical protein
VALGRLALGALLGAAAVALVLARQAMILRTRRRGFVVVGSIVTHASNAPDAAAARTDALLRRFGQSSTSISSPVTRTA